MSGDINQGEIMTLLEKTLQAVGEERATVGVNDDDLQAGYDSVAGGFKSYPLTTTTGYSKWYASSNSGAFNVNYTNLSHGQSTIYSVPDVGNAVGRKLVAAGAAPFVSGNLPMASGTAGVMVDSGIAAANYNPLTVSVTMNTASVTGAYAAPVQILASPGAGKAIMVINSQIITEVSTPFATGGVAQIQYGNAVHGSGVLALDATTPAAEITAASSQIYSQKGFATATVTATSAVTNQALYFSNATGAYTNGTGSTVTVVLMYLIVSAV